MNAEFRTESTQKKHFKQTLYYYDLFFRCIFDHWASLYQSFHSFNSIPLAHFKTTFHETVFENVPKENFHCEYSFQCNLKKITIHTGATHPLVLIFWSPNRYFFRIIFETQ